MVSNMVRLDKDDMSFAKIREEISHGFLYLVSLQDAIAIEGSKCARFKLKCRWMILCAIKGILGNSYDNVKKKIIR